MSVGVITSDIFKKHKTYGHPESPERLDAILSYIKDKEAWKKSEKLDIRKITPEELYSVHLPEYVDSVKTFCENGGGRIDEDTVTCPESYEVALYSSGSVLEGVDQVMGNKLDKVFCFIRPPGHHALPSSSKGFCLFSNLSLGAMYAISKYKLNRIMVLDWDVHHGNGTESIFYNSNKVFTVSWHQYPFWPFTGNYTDTGQGDGLGYNINIPIPAGFTDEIYVETFENIIIPAIKKYKPELIMMAAGYDAHRKDPLAGLNVTTPVYSYLSKRTVEFAHEFCNGKIVATLEGGYNPESLSEGVYETLNYMQFPDLKLNGKTAMEKDTDRDKIKKLTDIIIKTHPFFR